MAQSLSKILLHCVFSTKGRAQLILNEFETELYAYVAEVCRSQGSHAFRVGGTNNHIHIACTLSRTVPVSKLLEEVKRSSSKWMKKKGSRNSLFSWQAGYSVFSLGMSQLKVLIRYINTQKEHHRGQNFKTELLELLKKYEIDYDERYLWD